MAAGRHVQPSFVGGELSPQLAGRIDLARFAVGVAKCRNMIITAQGCARTRPGFELLGEVSTSGLIYGFRLIPFIFSATEACVIEASGTKFRFWKDGALITNGGSAVSVTTPYSSSDLAKLRFTQAGDIVTIVHPNYEPRELRRTDWVTWSLDVISYAPRLTPPTGLTHYNGNVTNTDKRDWEWVVTSVDSTTGEESAPSAVYKLTVYLEASAIDKRLKLAWDPVEGVTEYNVYRGRNGFFGFIGTAKDRELNPADKWEFNDDNFTPVYGSPPPKGASPFAGAGNYPSDTCYFEQRQVFARSALKPQTLWASMSGAFKSFTRAEPPRADDAIEITIASQRIDEIRALFPLQSLLVFTAGGVLTLNPNGDQPLSSDNAMPRVIGGPGAGWVPPLLAKDSALFVTNSGNVIRDVSYSWADQGYKGNDLTVLARHLFDGFSIIDWAYSEAPAGVLWVVRSDGALLGLTMQKEHDVWGWHRHDIADDLLRQSDDGANLVSDYFGRAMACCVIPEGGEDRLYLIVQASPLGTQKYHVVRLGLIGSQRTDTVPFLDFSKIVQSSTVYRRSASFAKRSDLGLEDVQPTVAGSSIDITNTSGIFSGSTGKTFVMKGTESMVRLTITSVVSSTRVRGTIDTDLPEDLSIGVLAEEAGFGQESIAGLTSYAGLTVAVVADGVYHGTLTVSGGGVLTLSQKYRGLNIAIGFPYPQELRLLDLQIASDTPVVERQKLIHSITVKARRAYDFMVGMNKRRTWPASGAYGGALLQYIDPPSRPITVKLGGTFDQLGRTSIYNENGEYLEVNAVVRDVLVGE